jgi:hypothetical protein
MIQNPIHGERGTGKGSISPHALPLCQCDGECVPERSSRGRWPAAAVIPVLHSWLTGRGGRAGNGNSRPLRDGFLGREGGYEIMVLLHAKETCLTA